MEKSKFSSNNQSSGKRLFINRQGKAEKIAKEGLCPIVVTCGSCISLEENYNYQLTQKSLSLRNLVKVTSPNMKNVQIRDCIPSPATLGYRKSIKLVVSSERGGDDKVRISIGLFKPSTHNVVDIGRCPVQSDRINEVLAYLRGEIWRQNLSTYNERTQKGLLRHVVIRNSLHTNQVLIILVVTENEPKLKAFARSLCEKFSFINGIVLHINKSSGNAIFSHTDSESFDDPCEKTSNDALLAGNPYLLDKLCDLSLRFSATSFMQINPEVAQKIYYRMLEIADLKGTESVLDLYCGVGTISLLFAGKAARVYGVEETESAIIDAEFNAKENKLTNAKFFHGRAEEALPKLVASKDLPEAVDVVTLNPSRRGCQIQVLEAVAALNPKTIIYMSCNPKTLLRDLDNLYSLGYKTLSLEPFDMFPRTLHYEVLAHLVSDKIGSGVDTAKPEITTVTEEE